VERAPAHAELLGGAALIPAVFLERIEDALPAIVGRGRPARPRCVRLDTEIARHERVASTKEDAPRDHVLELANVARPIVSEQAFDRVGRERDTPFRGLFRELRCEQADLGASLAERRHVDRQAIEPEIEIASKRALLHHFRKAPIRRADEAHVDRNRADAADTRDLAILEKPEKLRLQGGRELPDLVQKERPALRRFGKTDLRLRRPRERAALVTEELAFEKIFDERCAVELEKRLVGAGRGLVHARGEDLLTYAGLADEEDGELALRDDVDELVDLRHRGIDLGRGHRRGGRATANHDHRRPELDDGPGADGDCGAWIQLRSIEECPVGAPMIVDANRSSLDRQRGVPPGHRRMIDHEIDVRSSADDDRAVLREVARDMRAAPHRDDTQAIATCARDALNLGDVVVSRHGTAGYRTRVCYARGVSTAPRVVGRYALYGQIASGGMATVHLGRMLGPLGFSKVVAIKRMHDEIANDRELVTMFLDEARLAARLQHPNIVSVVDIVAEGSELLIVMEYVKGAAVSTLLDEAARVGNACPPRIAVAILCNVLAGLHHAHETTDSRGERIELVHRDVSPQNVLVGIDGVARVLDFGIAKARGKMHLTRKDHLKGKVPYMAPELLERQPVDRRADVYAAGVMLWEMLAGRRLFEGPLDQALLARILTAPVPLVSEVRPGVDRYDEVVARAIHRDPTIRYQSAREMLLALERCGPVASASEVAAWVEPLVTRMLEARTALVHAIETSALGTGAEAEPLPRRRSPVLLPIMLAAVPLAGLLVFFGMRRPHAPPMIVDAGIAKAAEPDVEEPPPPSTPLVEPPAPIASEPRKKLPPARPRKDCDPPYVLDAAGHRRYKLECVR
jgi:hypothetical protein